MIHGSGWVWVLLVGGMATVLLIVSLVALSRLHSTQRGSTRLDTWRETSRKWAVLAELAELRGNDEFVGEVARTYYGYMDGHLLRSLEYMSMMVCAPSGAGKTTRLVAPIAMLWNGPCVVTSVKTDAYDLTFAARGQIGPVKVLDPCGETGRPSVSVSPTQDVDTYADAVTAAEYMCDASKTAVKNHMTNEDFWDEMGKRVFAPMIYLAAHIHAPITEMLRWLQSRSGEEEVERKLADLHGDKQATLDWGTFMRMEPRMKDSTLQTCRMLMRGWCRPDIAHIVDVTSNDPMREVLDIECLFDGSNTTFYLVAPQDEQESLAPVFGFVVNKIIRRAARTQGRKGPMNPALLLLLDEAANIAPIRKLPQLLSWARGVGLVVVHVWQDEAQLELTYSREEARVIRSNSFAKMYLPGIQDEQTLDNIIKAVGKDEYESISTTLGDHTSSRTLAHHVEQVADPELIRAMPKNQAVLIAGQYKAARISIPAWYENDQMRRLVNRDIAAAYDQAFVRAATTDTHSKTSRAHRR
jgi:type IV secretory pathway TraG/TraD family ATPase VirD4